MRLYFISGLKTGLHRVMGKTPPAKEERLKKFKRLAGENWYAEPDRFCKEEEKINPVLIGRFYGENSIKKCALEVRQTNGKIAFRCAWRTRSSYSWANKALAASGNAYHSLTIKGGEIGDRHGLSFRRGRDGRFYMGYRHHMEIVMKKL
ncbi:MAG: hypothetical protein V6Z89_01080 [Desulfobacter sp.]